MFENIPNFEIVALIALSVVGLIAVVMCVSRFLENEKDNANKKKIAVMNGEQYDTVNEELSRKFWYGYLIVAVVGAVVAVALGLIVTDLVLAEHSIDSESRLTAVCVGICSIVWVFCDYFLFTRIGDTAYYRAIEKKAIESFLSPETAEPETMTEEPDENKLTLTREEKLALLEKIL